MVTIIKLWKPNTRTHTYAGETNSQSLLATTAPYPRLTSVWLDTGSHGLVSQGKMYREGSCPHIALCEGNARTVRINALCL